MHLKRGSRKPRAVNTEIFFPYICSHEIKSRGSRVEGEQDIGHVQSLLADNPKPRQIVLGLRVSRDNQPKKV